MMTNEDKKDDQPVQKSFFDRAFSLFKNNNQDILETKENNNGSQNNSKIKSVIPIILQDDSRSDSGVQRTEHLVNMSYQNTSVAVNSAFFDITSEGSNVRIRLNEDHPIFPLIEQAMDAPSSLSNWFCKIS